MSDVKPATSTSASHCTKPHACQLHDMCQLVDDESAGMILLRTSNPFFIHFLTQSIVTSIGKGIEPMSLISSMAAILCEQIGVHRRMGFPLLDYPSLMNRYIKEIELGFLETDIES